MQPISLTRLYKYDFREGLKYIKSLTNKPFGVNITILPKTVASARYAEMNEEFADVAIEEGVKFLLTSLGKPDEIVKKAHENGVKVYHDVHNAKLAMRAVDAGVDGLNLLNSRMGGQTGSLTKEQIVADVREALGDAHGSFPLLCAGGISTAEDLKESLNLGYAGAQCGTRFLATKEAEITKEYKVSYGIMQVIIMQVYISKCTRCVVVLTPPVLAQDAIVNASSKDIVWTNKLAGTNSSVINTETVSEGGLRTNSFVSFMLKQRMTKSLTRLFLLNAALDKYAQAAFDPAVQYWQAGKGVEGIDEILTCEEVIRRFEGAGDPLSIEKKLPI